MLWYNIYVCVVTEKAQQRGSYYFNGGLGGFKNVVVAFIVNVMGTKTIFFLIETQGNVMRCFINYTR